MELTVKPATEKEIPAIVALVNSVYRGESSRAGWTTEADFLAGQRTDPDSILEMMKKPNTVFLSLRQGVDLLGSIYVEKHAEICHFAMLAVVATLQTRGYGKKLLTAAEDWAKNQFGCKKIEMEVISIRTELIEYYLRQGYYKTGRSLPFPYGNEKFGIPKVQDLKFTELGKIL